jgi:hypothetical protein
VNKSRTALLLGATAGLVLAFGGPASADTTVTAKMTQLNKSGASGTVSLTATDDGRLTVVIHTKGLVPGQPHAQHIHGAIGGHATHFMCPTLANDKDNDGILTNEEAVGEYGAIYLPLTTRGDVSAASALALDRMPVADAQGNLNYKRTFTAAEVPDALLDHLSEVHIVQHGIDANDNVKYDLAGLGESSFAKNLGVAGVPEEATDPASCGVIMGAAAPAPPKGGVATGGGSSAAGSNGAGSMNSVGLTSLGALLLALSAAVFSARRTRESGS